ncbi:MAG: RES family NAD+ phosphorylase [Candidatus Omnitrophica bacterium]|nr:RES family NAD+ phosphorylase [Candidatus Omnitrophota bacterium]
MSNQRHRSLEDYFLKIKPTPLSAPCYRIVSPKYDVLNTNGSLQYLGRYSNRRFRVLYTAAAQEVCKREQARKTTVRTKFTYKIAKLNVKLKKALDLTNEKNLKMLKIQKDELVSEDWTLTQHIASLAYQNGYEALVIPSVTEKGNNIVLFPENFTKESTLKKVEEKAI